MRQSIRAACPFDYIIVGFGFFLLGFAPEFHRRWIYTNMTKLMEIRIIKKEWSKWSIESCYYPEPKGSWLKCQNKGPRISSVI